MLKETERDKMGNDTHENISHRDIVYIYYEISNRFSRPNIKKQIENIIKKMFDMLEIQ